MAVFYKSREKKIIEFYIINLYLSECVCVAYSFFRPDGCSCAIIRCAISHLAIIVDASKFTQFREKEGKRVEIIKAILLRSERRRRLREAKNERQNFLIGRP